MPILQTILTVSSDDEDDEIYDDEDDEDYVSPEDAKLEFEMGRGDYLRDRAKDERAER